MGTSSHDCDLRWIESGNSRCRGTQPKPSSKNHHKLRGLRILIHLCTITVRFYILTLIFHLTQTLYMGVVLYGPAVALDTGKLYFLYKWYANNVFQNREKIGKISAFTMECL